MSDNELRHVVSFPAGISPFQIDFPEYKTDERGKVQKTNGGDPIPFGERSVKGSIHIQPNSTRIITQSELNYIKKTLPGLNIKQIATIGEEPTGQMTVFETAVPQAKDSWFSSSNDEEDGEI